MINLFKPIALIKHLLIISFVVSIAVSNFYQISLQQTATSSEFKPVLEDWSLQDQAMYTQLSSTEVGKLKSNQPQEVSIKYQIFGTDELQNLSLNVRLSKGISIVADSVFDTYNDKEVKVDNSLLLLKNQITYGPGTSKDTQITLSGGDAGNLRFKITITDPSIQNYVLVSYIKDGQGKIVQPSLIQLSI
jgi:hypothetical protein